MYAQASDRPNATQLILPLAITAAIACLLVSPASAQRRPRSQRQIASQNPPATTAGGLVTHDLATGGETPESLVQALVGSGAIVSNVQYTGAPIAAGTFSGGTGIIGFEQGVILSSGDVANVVGSVNSTCCAFALNGMPGDPDLDGVIFDPPSNGYSNDAAVLEFDLDSTSASQISFQYVFASEEYDEGVQSNDDLFCCFVNGQNIALIPGTIDHVGVMLVHCGPQYDPPLGRNCGFYKTNDCDSLGLGFPCSHIAMQGDGLTVVLTGTGAMQPGLNHIKLAIADQGDQYGDSFVFLRGGSLVGSSGPPVFETPSSCLPVLKGWAGVPLTFDINAWATNRLPGESATLSVTGDSVPLTNGTFLPPLPTGPAQPVGSQFLWTPTPADVGLYHLDFTATDQLQQSALLDVPIQISIPGAPVFDAPSPCGQILDALNGVPLSFGITASGWTSAECGTNGSPGPSVTLSVTGDAPPLAGGTFVPPLPAGPSQTVSTQFLWTPTPADVGLYHLVFTATDEFGRSTSCDVGIHVTFSPPQFWSPIWCGQTLYAYAGQTFNYPVNVAATNGQPGESVILDVTGDSVPLTGGTFDPPLPAGPAQQVVSWFQWTPTLADVGLYHITFTATDQLQQITTCDSSIRVWGLPGVDQCQPGTGLVIPCPCNNSPASDPRGCDNSAATGGARLESVGGPVIGEDENTLLFTTSGETPNALTVLFQGDALRPAGAIYGQGVRCVGGRLVRLYVESASGGSITAPGSGEERVWMRSRAHGDTIHAGSTRYYAAYYRDPTLLGGCPPSSTFNITQTQAILWMSH